MTDNSLLQDFITETGEHLEEVERNVLRLEQQPDDTAVLNEIFRSIHTIKGSAEYLGMERIAELSHKLESLLDLLRRGERTVNADTTDLLMACNDRIGVLVNELDQHQVEKTAIDDLLVRLEGGADQVASEAEAASEADAQDDGLIEDEYDEELFGIFVEQLTEGLTGLAGDAEQLHGAQGGLSVLESMVDRLGALRSSANYMGYDDLKALYDQWSQAVDQAVEKLKAGQEIDLEGFAADVMQANLDRVKAMFPKVSFPALAVSEQAPAQAEEQEEQTLVEESQTADQSLLADFIAETGEHLEEVERNVLRLEQQPDDTAVLNEIFRSIHTIKGSAEYLGMERIAELSHKLESLLDLLRRGERTVNADTTDLLMACNDRIGVLVNELDQHQVEKTAIDDLTERLTVSLQPDTPSSVQAEPPIQPINETEQASKVIYAEEYDKELFAIFMGQLNDGLQAISDEAEKLRNGEPIDEVLARCLDRVATLRSSANYMEYNSLRDTYDVWRQQIDAVRGQIASGVDVDSEIVVQNTIDANIQHVKSFFTAPEAADKQAAVVMEVSQKPTGNGHDLATAIEEQFKELDPGFDSVSIDDINDDMQIPALDSPKMDEDDVELLNKLASAFDAQLGSSVDKFEPPLSEDIENHLLSGIETGKKFLDASALSEEIQDQLPSETPDPIENVETVLFSDSKEDLQPVDEEPDKSIASEPEPVAAETVVEPLPETEQRRNRYNRGRRQSDKFHERVQKQSLRVDAAKIDALMNQVGELVVSRSGFNQLFADMRELQLTLKQSNQLETREMQQIKEITNRIQAATISLGRVTAELQENVMKVRMLPIAQLFSRYPRVVHDLVRNTEKKVELEILGEETELDKMVIEQLADPLIHIIRNAVDHGIEDISVRRQKGKLETGVLRLEAYHEANFVMIEISDDGQGIDIPLIRKRALELGFVSDADLEQMNENEIMNLIMRPGFSTAAEITHTSGRGVGMDVVKDSIEKLNGTVEIESNSGAGARFKIKIPLTLAIIPALLVRLAEETFAIPLSTVEETIRVAKDEISTIEGVEVFSLRESTIPLIKLSRVFNMASKAESRDELFVVIVNTGAKQVGFVVDDLRAQQEVVIKPLEDYLQEKSGFSGATILGDGSISLILDVYELVELSLDQHSSKSTAAVV